MKIKTGFVNEKIRSILLTNTILGTGARTPKRTEKEKQNPCHYSVKGNFY